MLAVTVAVVVFMVGCLVIGTCLLLSCFASCFLWLYLPVEAIHVPLSPFLVLLLDPLALINQLRILCSGHLFSCSLINEPVVTPFGFQHASLMPFCPGLKMLC